MPSTTAKKAGNKHQLAVQLYTVRDHCKTPDEVSRTLARIAAIGYKFVDASVGGGVAAAEDFARRCERAGVWPIGCHSGLESWEAQYEVNLASLRVFDCRYTTISYIVPELRTDFACWKRIIQRLARLGRRLAKDGVVLQYHNHRFEFEKFKGKTVLEHIYGSVPPTALWAQLDTCWVARGGGDPAQWLLSLKGRMDQVHIKDTTVVADQEKFAEVGEGSLNWDAILAACRKCGIKHYIVEQDADWRGGDPFKSLAISYKFLSARGLR